MIYRLGELGVGYDATQSSTLARGRRGPATVASDMYPSCQWCLDHIRASSVPIRTVVVQSRLHRGFSSPPSILFKFFYFLFFSVIFSCDSCNRQGHHPSILFLILQILFLKDAKENLRQCTNFFWKCYKSTKKWTKKVFRIWQKCTKFLQKVFKSWENKARKCAPKYDEKNISKFDQKNEPIIRIKINQKMLKIYYLKNCQGKCTEKMLEIWTKKRNKKKLNKKNESKNVPRICLWNMM